MLQIDLVLNPRRGAGGGPAARGARGVAGRAAALAAGRVARARARVPALGQCCRVHLCLGCGRHPQHGAAPKPRQMHFGLSVQVQGRTKCSMC